MKKYFQVMISGIGIGLLSALCCHLFSELLSLVTLWRRQLSFYPFLFLPFLAPFTYWIYHHLAKKEERGNDLVIEEIHRPLNKIRFRMVPLIFLMSLVSHFLGASVGREGVGVQMGAGIADQFSHQYFDRKLLLMMGMSAGFASMFRTPLAASIFGIEVLVVGSYVLEALIPTLISSYVAYYTVTYFEGSKLEYPHINLPTFSFTLWLKSVISAVLIGLLARIFLNLLHFVHDDLLKRINSKNLFGILGGTILLCVFFLIGHDRYHGISLEILHDSYFGQVSSFDYLLKMLTTIFSAGIGLKGGEVMPIFIIGASFGKWLSTFLITPTYLLTSLGMLGLFVGTVNTPLATLFLSLELFGTESIIYSMTVIAICFLISGDKSILKSQKRRKHLFTHSFF